MKYVSKKLLAATLLILTLSGIVTSQTALPIEKKNPATSTEEVKYTELRLGHEAPKGVSMPEDWFFRLDSWAYDDGKSSQGIVSSLGFKLDTVDQTALYRGNASIGVNTPPYVNERTSSNPLHLTEWALITEFENGEVCAWYQENCFQLEQIIQEKRDAVRNTVENVELQQKEIDQWHQEISANIIFNQKIEEIPAAETSGEKYQASIVIKTGTEERIISGLFKKTDNQVRIEKTHSASYLDRESIANTWHAEEVCVRFMGVELECQDFEKPDTDTGNSEYTVRDMNQITDYLGGNIDNTEPKTEIKFGNNLQNSLYIHSVEGSYDRELEIQASARSKDNDRFTLSWDNMINGVKKEFNSGEYTVHLCGDSETGNGGVTTAISKYGGSQGYGACFNDEKQGLKEASEYSSIEYEEGEKVNVSEGEKLVFGQNVLFVDSYDYVENIDMYTMDAYANKLSDNHRIRPVSGTSTEGYFYEGEYALHFCEYYESEEEGELAVSQENKDECADQENEDQDEDSDNSQSTQTIELNRGWNNIAVNVEGATLSEAASEGSCEFQGDGHQVGPYEAFIFKTDTSENGFAPISLNEELDPSVGYTIGVLESCTLEFSGSEALSYSYERKIPGGQWNLITLPAEFSPNDLKDMVADREGVGLHTYQDKYFHVHEGQSNGEEIWTYPTSSLSNDKSVWVAPTKDITVDFTTSEIGTLGL